MKRISILAVIALVLMVVEMFSSLINYYSHSDATWMIESIMKGMNPTSDPNRFATFAQDLNVYPIETNENVHQAFNTLSSGNTPYIPNKVVAGGWIPVWVQIVIGVIGIASFPIVIWGLICFIRLLISVSKNQIFTRLNTRRLRIFVYGVFGSVALFQLIDWFTYHYISRQITLDGYLISDYETIVSWGDIFLVVLIVEIFAKGVKLQEEQELTI